MDDLTAKERADMLIAQCAMWCRMTRHQPIPAPTGSSIDGVILLMAIHPNKRDFLQLNHLQRCLLAGMEKPQ